MSERPTSVRVDILVVTDKGERRARVDLSSSEDGARFVERLRNELHAIGGYTGPEPHSERKFVQLARLVADDWNTQEGLNAQRLDDLAAAYVAINKPNGE